MDFDALSDFRWFQQADFGCSINQAFKEAFAHSKLGLFRHPFGDGIVVIRYALLEKLSRHPLMQSQNRSTRGAGPDKEGALAKLFEHHPVFHDEPGHRTTRQAAFQAVGWRGTDEIEATAEHIARGLVGGFSSGECIDLVEDYAYPLFAQLWVTMLGLPKSGAVDLRGWAEEIQKPLRFQPTEKMLVEANQGAQNILDFMVAKAHGLVDADDGNSLLKAYLFFLNWIQMQLLKRRRS